MHNGVDPARFPLRLPVRDAALAAELGIDDGAPVVGIVAVLRPEKDHETLLRAIRMVREEIPDAQLLVIGDGPQRGRLEALTAELGITAAVRFAGVRSDVGRVLGLLDVVTLSSYTVECFPMALLEAMASGVPTVGTAVGGVPEMIDDGTTGYVVPPRDPRALADALIKMLRRPAAHRGHGPRRPGPGRGAVHPRALGAHGRGHHRAHRRPRPRRRGRSGSPWCWTGPSSAARSC